MNAVRVLYLIRHGQYDTSVDDPNGGSLTELGREQARQAGVALAHIPARKIYASTMTRAIETAQLVNESLNVEIETSDLLREAIPSIPPRIAPHIMMLMHKNPNITHESIHEDQKRADKAFETFFTTPDGDIYHDVIVCHGNIIRYLTCKVLGINTDKWANMDISHGAITIITVDHEGLMRLNTHNSNCHLPHDHMTD